MISLHTIVTVGKYIAGTSVAVTVLLAGGLWYFQCHLIYPSYAPKGSRLNVPKPTDVGLPYEDVTLITPDGVKIKGYLIPARRRPVSSDEIRAMNRDERRERMKKEIEGWVEELGREDAVQYIKSRPTVVIFHANAGNMGHRIPLARTFNVDMGCNVFMLSYRGYGLSEGIASEHGIRIDAQAAMEYVTTHPLLSGTKIILYGQSIGGAVCLDVASLLPEIPSGVIIENTFVSLPFLIPQVLPGLPKVLLPVLLTERWDATLTLPRIPSTTPILFLAGRKDELIPPTHMTELFKLRGTGRSRWRDFDGGHNDTCIKEGYWDAINEWLHEEVLGHVKVNTEATGEIDEKSSEEEGSEKGKVEGGWEKVEMNAELEAKKDI